MIYDNIQQCENEVSVPKALVKSRMKHAKVCQTDELYLWCKI